MMFLQALVLAPVLGMASPIVSRDVVPDPSDVHINGVTYGGTGCPQGTVGVAISEDRTIMTLIFDEYVASIGPDVPLTESRKNCQLNIDLLYPPGFQYSIFSADYRGYAALDANVNGTIKATYYFSGEAKQASSETVLVGPLDSDYLKHDKAISTSEVWSPCGEEALLNINSQIRLSTNVSGASGLLTTDSVDSKFTQIAYINWQTCNGSSSGSGDGSTIDLGGIHTS